MTRIQYDSTCNLETSSAVVAAETIKSQYFTKNNFNCDTNICRRLNTNYRFELYVLEVGGTEKSIRK